MKKRITLDYSNVMDYISQHDLDRVFAEVVKADEKAKEGTGAGNKFLGWKNLPSRYLDGDLSEELEKIERVAGELRENSEVFISIGIGGSYLGARAVIEALSCNFPGKKPEIYFAGQNIDPDFMNELLDMVGRKSVSLNVISKSGTTTEPAIAFRLLKTHLEMTVGKAEARKRIVATTDRQKGALKKLADMEGIETFAVPDDVGGRFSVLTPVGLLPIAVAGIDIKELLRGAAAMEDLAEKESLEDSPIAFYVAIRNLLYRKERRDIEILVNFSSHLHYLAEWWKQLFGESEGKDWQGIFPAAADFTTDLHSMGQLIQDGKCNIFETFLMLDEPIRDILITEDADNLDGLNFLAGKTMHYVNRQAYEGTRFAHLKGGVPNMTIDIPRLNPYYIGQVLYFFERAVAISGYLQGVNPFDQPGVEDYKNNMFALLGKPGFEEKTKEIKGELEGRKVYKK